MLVLIFDDGVSGLCFVLALGGMVFWDLIGLCVLVFWRYVRLA